MVEVTKNPNDGWIEFETFSNYLYHVRGLRLEEQEVRNLHMASVATSMKNTLRREKEGCDPLRRSASHMRYWLDLSEKRKRIKKVQKETRRLLDEAEASVARSELVQATMDRIGVSWKPPLIFLDGFLRAIETCSTAFDGISQSFAGIVLTNTKDAVVPYLNPVRDLDVRISKTLRHFLSGSSAPNLRNGRDSYIDRFLKGKNGFGLVPHAEFQLAALKEKGFDAQCTSEFCEQFTARSIERQARREALLKIAYEQRKVRREARAKMETPLKAIEIDLLALRFVEGEKWPIRFGLRRDEDVDCIETRVLDEADFDGKTHKPKSSIWLLAEKATVTHYVLDLFWGRYGLKAKASCALRPPRQQGRVLTGVQTVKVLMRGDAVQVLLKLEVDFKVED